MMRFLLAVVVLAEAAGLRTPALAELAFRDSIPASPKAGLRVEIRGTAEESWVLRDPQGASASIQGLASESGIVGCSVAASPDVISGDCGGYRGSGSSFAVVRPILGDWILTLTCKHPKCRCSLDTRVRFIVGRSDGVTGGWDVLRLTGTDSLTWVVHVTRGSVQVERTTIVRSMFSALVVSVVDSTSGVLVGVPYANVEVNGKTSVSNEEGVLRADVDSAGQCVIRVRALGWEVQPADTVALVGGQAQELRHVMRGHPPLVKY